MNGKIKNDRQTMTKERYMALADLQSIWNNSIKPYIGETYATKDEAGTDYASVQTCEDIIAELT